MDKKFAKNLSRFQGKLKKDGIFDLAGKILGKFPAGEVYLVGGAVRDALLGADEQKDYDLVVRNIKAKDLKKTLAESGKVNLAGKNFGVFKFRSSRLPQLSEIDIVLPRTEHSLDFTGGYRDFHVQSDPFLPIGKDLSRRDFTVNAIAFQLSTFNFQLSTKLIDPFDGLKDLKAKIIRTVGKPGDRFREDYSRLLRALRFSCQLGFSAQGQPASDWSIEKNTWDYLKKFIAHINDLRENQERVVPYETIAKEFLESFFFNPVKSLDLWDESGALKLLVPELLKMKGCPQPPNWHSEGDVWTHTRLALEKLSSPEFKKQFVSKTTISPVPSLSGRGAAPSSSSPWQGEVGEGSETIIKDRTELIMAVLFHDLGKPYAIKTPEKDGTDRIRFNGHDAMGAELAAKICRRLKLSSPKKYGVDADRVVWLVKNHMFFTNSKVEEMKNSTIEKYFFNPNFSGENLLKLAFADALATVPEKGKSDLANFRKVLKRIGELKNLSKEKNRLPPPILNGHEIMKKLKLPPGPRIGELLDILREEQLAKRVKNKKEAIAFLKKFR